MIKDLKIIKDFISSENKRKIAADIIENNPEMVKQFKKAKKEFQRLEKLFKPKDQYSVEEYFRELLVAVKTPIIALDDNDLDEFIISKEIGADPILELEKIKKIPRKRGLGSKMFCILVCLRKIRLIRSLKNYNRSEFKERAKIMFNVNIEKINRYFEFSNLCVRLPQIFCLVNKKYNLIFYLKYAEKIADYLGTFPDKNSILNVKMPAKLIKAIPEKWESGIFSWNTPEVEKKTDVIFSVLDTKKKNEEKVKEPQENNVILAEENDYDFFNL